MVVLKEEIGTAVTIESISFMINTPGWGSLTKEDVTFYLALSDQDELSAVFSENYITGTRIEVLHLDAMDLSGEQGDWMQIEFETPFWYLYEHNLLLEISTPEYDGCYAHFYGWDPDSDRSLYNYDIAADQGNLLSEVPYMKLEGTLSLEQNTFGRIKVVLGRDEHL
ncbi:MAG: hypothetical protein KAR40_17830 [Candidatus Sabulitectum sp.]|nr:hypothetical protein [Candidatus Sabulitectum sp.]